MDRDLQLVHDEPTSPSSSSSDHHTKEVEDNSVEDAVAIQRWEDDGGRCPEDGD
jgi:hypothetical protein